MKFSDVIGQEEAKNRLRDLVKEHRIPNTLMLCGPAGSGKMALALAFASYLLGERDGETSLLSDPRAIANAEAMLAKWEHPDLHFTFPVIKPTGTSPDHKMSSDDFISRWNAMLLKSPYFTMDSWLSAMEAANQQAIIGAGESDELIKKLSLKSSQGGYKVSIIWLPERMNVECANKLLKLLEEPPHQTVFIMVCEEPELLLDTIKSRTQRIDIKRIDDADIEQALIALENLDAGNENRAFLDMFIMLMRLAYQRDIRELKKWSEVIASYGREKQRRFISYTMSLVRENFMYNFQVPELCFMTLEEETFSRKFARFINEANVIDINDLLQKARRDIGQNANARIVFFDLALQMIVLLIRK